MLPLIMLTALAAPPTGFAAPIAPEIEITVTPTRLTPAQGGLVMVSGGYPLQIEATLDNEPFSLFWSGEAYMGVFSYGFEEPAGIHRLEVAVFDPYTGETAQRSEELTVIDYDYPDELVALPFALIPLLEPGLNQNEIARLKEVYSRGSVQTGMDWPFAIPVPNGIVTSEFGGNRTYNSGIWNQYHTGVDFRRKIGEPVLAAADGTVVAAERFDVRGNLVVLDHGNGVFTQYAHLSEFVVDEGDFIQKGELIGLAGSTGRINGPHLHFEIIVNGNEVDPIRWMSLTPGFVSPRIVRPEVSDEEATEEPDADTEVDEPTGTPEITPTES